MAPQHFDDPVAAYDQLAPHYAQLCLRRTAYLQAVEDLIVGCIPPGRRSLLDLGSGEGKRALRIAKRASLQRIVLVEPAMKMSAQHSEAELWPIRAEDLNPAAISERFDVITCLWNVLGHVPTPVKRERALQSAAGLLSRDGLFFLDVIHRYNLRSYGALPTCARWIRDCLAWSESNGDVRAKMAGRKTEYLRACLYAPRNSALG